MIKFSIIIPVKAINDYIREAVPHIQQLTGFPWELLIIPDEAEATEWPNDQRIMVVTSGRVGPADKRDLGGRLASGDILVFLDDDSFPESDLLEVASKHFLDPDVIAIGGPGRTPPSNSFWQRVSGAVFLSRLTGGAPERYVPVGQVRAIEDWPSVNLMVRQDTFMYVGGFDCKYWPGEDTKLCLKLKQTGKRLLYVPEMVVWHHRRAGLVAHLKQVGAYGLHRGYFARYYPETSFRLKYFIPTAFVLFVLMSLLGLWLPELVSNLLIGGWVAYALALLIGMTEALKFEKVSVVLVSVLYLPPTHFFYGIQFVRGYGKQSELVSRLR